jgi:hypothetical protein
VRDWPTQFARSAALKSTGPHRREVYWNETSVYRVRLAFKADGIESGYANVPA